MDKMNRTAKPSAGTAGRKNRLGQAITATLERKHCLTANDLRAEIVITGRSPHKTSIYRELERLCAKGVVQELQLRNDEKLYELADEAHHHHHLICHGCKKIIPIDFADDLDSQANGIAKKHGFKVTDHSLEFFGFCESCS